MIIIIDHFGTAKLVILIWVQPSVPNVCHFHLNVTMLVCILVFGFVHACGYSAFEHIHSCYNSEFGALLKFFIAPFDHSIHMVMTNTKSSFSFLRDLEGHPTRL